MKTFLNIASTLLLSGTAFSQTTWVETALWKAPQVTSFTIKLLNKEKLNVDCGVYHRAMYEDDGTLTTIAEDAARVAKYRRPFDPIVLELDVKPYERVEQTIVAKDEQKEDKLPHFTQYEATTGAVLHEAEKIRISAKEKSYTVISRNLGLEDSEVELFQNRAKYYLKISGRDAACDLYEGNGHITMTAPSYVLLEQDGVSKIEEFYNKKLLPELRDVVFSKTDNLTQKAARIGYRTGKILEDEFTGQKESVSEKQLIELMKTLFDSKTLAPTSKLIKTEQSLYLNLDGEANGKNVVVKLEF